MENRPDQASPRSRPPKKAPAERPGVLMVRIRAGDENFIRRRQGQARPCL